MLQLRYIASQPTDVFCVSRVAVLVVCFRQSYAHRRKHTVSAGVEFPELAGRD